jgi:hypothetical protein
MNGAPKVFRSGFSRAGNFNESSFYWGPTESKEILLKKLFKKIRKKENIFCGNDKKYYR